MNTKRYLVSVVYWVPLETPTLHAGNYFNVDFSEKEKKEVKYLVHLHAIAYVQLCCNKLLFHLRNEDR